MAFGKIPLQYVILSSSESGWIALKLNSSSFTHNIPLTCIKITYKKRRRVFLWRIAGLSIFSTFWAFWGTFRVTLLASRQDVLSPCVDSQVIKFMGREMARHLSTVRNTFWQQSKERLDARKQNTALISVTCCLFYFYVSAASVPWCISTFAHI